MFTEGEEIGGLFGLWRSYVATPVVAIERLEFPQTQLTEALVWFRKWREKRGDKAKGVEMIVMSESRYQQTVRDWIDAFFRDPLVEELSRKMPVEITRMDDAATSVEKFKFPAAIRPSASDT